MWSTPTLLLAAAALLSSLTRVEAICLTDANADLVANNFATLFSNYSEAFANKTLAVDYTDQTDSVSWLISNGTACSKPLGALSFSSRAGLEAAQAMQPNLPFVVENIFHDCTNVFIRWEFDVKPQQVQGIAILQTVPNTQCEEEAESQPYLIKNVFSEFNTAAFITKPWILSWHLSLWCGSQMETYLVSLT